MSNTADKAIYQGNGSNVNFAIPHQIVVNDQNETLVYLRDETVPTSPVITLQTYGALQNYILTGANPPTTPFNNNVQMNVAPTSSQKLIIIRLMPLTEVLNLLTSGNFDYANLNTELIRIVAMIQQLNEITTRAPVLSIGTTQTQLNIPEPQPNTVLGFDSTPSANLMLYQVPGQLPVATESEVVLADNTSGQSLTGFSISALVYSSAILRYSLLRTSSAGTLREVGYVVLTYDNTNSVWRISNPTFGPDVGGCTFSVTTSAGVGTLTVATDSFSLGGTSIVDKIRFKVIDAALVET